MAQVMFNMEVLIKTSILFVQFGLWGKNEKWRFREIRIINSGSSTMKTI